MWLKASVRAIRLALSSLPWASRQQMSSHSLSLRQGERVSQEFLVEVLMEYGFERVDFVFEAGQYAVRGGIIDIFSYSSDHPYRVDFFGPEVDSIRSFDVVSQLSVARFEQVSILPNLQNPELVSQWDSIFDFVPPDSVFWVADTRLALDKIEQVRQSFGQDEGSAEGQALLGAEEAARALERFAVVELAARPFFAAQAKLAAQMEAQPPFNKNFHLLASDLAEKHRQGFRNLVFSKDQKQIDRLRKLFAEEAKGMDGIEFEPVLAVVHEGFVDHQALVCCYTDHQIFDRYHKFQLKSDKRDAGREALTLSEILNLQPGDYVVHVDHGVGKFAGLVRTEVNGKMQEAIQLLYLNNDLLLVNIHSLHRISKFRGQEGQAPHVNKLGSPAWAKLKQKTKSRVKDIAQELIKLYAQRKALRGHAFAADSYLQHALESSFLYEDTPDQWQATVDVKQDMESPMPMDRLVCGDVGFGKTEVAIRAAFKAVADGKQVAVLVPTTILAFQHYNTFRERLKELPCTVDYISRLKSAKQQSQTLKLLAEGKTDIIIGTHRLVGKDIQFKDLGLLVVDEEQKFGVGVKEKIKNIKLNVDTLTLTATPIPRTLQFSLMGARDMSVIKTPPPNRYPIVTELHGFNEEVIREAIQYEMDRNGQVFFIHNRVQNMPQVRDMLGRIAPKARVVVAHGQMEGTELEKNLLAFINEDYDVLLATTIVESGVDIPNANTIIINDAQNFGLSDLHQLRGRVGRSNKKAFCYLLTPPLATLTQEARRRVQAIENFSELGSGFSIAMQDLDIRGAGNLLGGEQSGFIADIGFETYQRILDEALLELRDSLFLEERLAQDGPGRERQASPAHFAQARFVSDCQVDTDLELLFPESYIQNIAERVKLYRELDNIEKPEQLATFAEQLRDRFGALPPQSAELLQVVRLRWLSMGLGIEKVMLKNGALICHFVSNQQSPFYSSPVFQKVLGFVQRQHRHCQMKESGGKLSLRLDLAQDVSQAIAWLEKMGA